MLHQVPRGEEGFTLTEMIVTAIVVGVLAAVSVPSLVGLYNQNKVKEASAQVEGALKEAQRQAMRRGKSCTVEIDTTNKKIKNPSGGDGCLLSERELGEQITLRTNISPLTISFSMKGSAATTASEDPTFVVSMPNTTSEQRCVVVASALGLMRSGNYTGSTTGTVDPDDCQTTSN
ncbi:type II secretion system protein [Pleurocapsales cyanobacterium LEGE 06147]|nr:type II secretion system protein [Pleurocapsales cyanobacterium LEGE 06147]